MANAATVPRRIRNKTITFYTNMLSTPLLSKTNAFAVIKSAINVKRFRKKCKHTTSDNFLSTRLSRLWYEPTNYQARCASVIIILRQWQ